MNPNAWPLWAIVAGFAISALVIGVVGTRLAARAEHLARATGMGQAVFGVVFLGGTTSISGMVTSVTAALDGRAELAMGNAVGGIAAQTVFLAVADALYPKANLEHAAASPTNLMQAGLLVTLLGLPILAMASPELAVVGIHPITPVIPIAYVLGLSLIRSARDTPMWAARQTPETAPEDERARGRTAGLAVAWLGFAVLALVIGAAGYAIAKTGAALATRTGLGESVVGTFFTSISTSLPELVTAIAAVRRGALMLAVGDILGGNCFDVLLVAASDVAFRGGAIYAAVGSRELFVMALSIVLAGVLLLGLLRREKHGIANIGFESMLVIVLYGLGAAYLAFAA